MKVLIPKFLKDKFNISEMEQSAVFTSWGLRLLYQIGFIISWTILVALFVENFGIFNLPFLFLSEALLVFGGSFLSGYILSKIHLSKFLLYSIVGTLGFLLGALVFNPFEIWFFVCIILAKGLFFSQLNIALYRRTETLFSSAQAQRLFSFIESSITIGTFLGAIITLTMLVFVPTEFVLFAWAASLLGMLLIINKTPKLLSFIPRVYEKNEKKQTALFYHTFLKLKKIPFLRYVGVIIVLQAILLTFIEIEFTKDVYQNIPEAPQYSSTEFSLSSVSLQASLFTDTVYVLKDMGTEITQEIKTISSRLIMHESLAHDLGVFNLIFALFALLFQFVITPKVLKKCGIIGTFISYFFLLLASLMSFFFGYISVNVLRLIQHTTHSLSESPYHISYYSIFHKSRESIRLFFEGILRPFGIICAVLFFLFFPDEWIWSIALVLVFISSVLFFPLKKNFTKLSEKNLQEKQELREKINAIQVFGQKGHKDSVHILTKELLKEDNHKTIREAIIHILADMKKPEMIHAYIQILSDEKEDIEIKRVILIKLAQIDVPDSYWEKHSFTRYHLLEILKKLFSESTDSHIKEKVVMSIFRHLPSHDSAPFFLETMESADERLKSIYLRSCHLFEDPEIVFYVQKYLKSSCPRIQSHAVIGLWKFEDRESLRDILYTLLQKNSTTSQVSALYALGEIKDSKSIEMIRSFVNHENKEVRLHAVIALVKIGDNSIVPNTLEFLFGESISFSTKTFYMLHRVSEKTRVKIQREIQRKVSEKVSKILKSQNIKTSSFSEESLKTLKHLYWLSGRYDDLMAIEGMSGK